MYIHVLGQYTFAPDNVSNSSRSLCDGLVSLDMKIDPDLRNSEGLYSPPATCLSNLKNWDNTHNNHCYLQ